MTAKKPVVSPLAQIKELENDSKLIKLCAEHLPSNYDFEIAKTVWRIRKTPNCHTVALQMPEGMTPLIFLHVLYLSEVGDGEFRMIAFRICLFCRFAFVCHQSRHSFIGIDGS